jgi:hypothetical protein
MNKNIHSLKNDVKIVENANHHSKNNNSEKKEIKKEEISHTDVMDIF